MNIENIAIDALKPYPGNARTHDEAQVETLAAAIRELGFRDPVEVDDDNMILAGHGRVLAAQRAGLAQVPCVRHAGLTEAQKRAYVLSSNQIGLLSGWDERALLAEIDWLEAQDFDLSLTGFDGEDIQAMLDRLNLDESAGAEGEGGESGEEDITPPANPVTRPGDIWLLGRHRLMCGDSTSPADVAALMAGARPHLMVTDPPYGVEYDAAWRNEAAKKGKIGQKTPTRATGKVANDDRADWREAWALFPGDVAYVWHAGTKSGDVLASLLASGFDIRAQIVWAKSHFAIGRGNYHCQHEPCFYAVRKGADAHWSGDRSQTTLWHIPKPTKSETGHSTQKPIECMRRPIVNNSLPGDSVYEPFSGSGTTLIAAERMMRACIAMELMPAYVDIAVRRWQSETGKSARHAETGQAFAQLAEARATSTQGA